MTVTFTDLRAATAKGIITPDQFFQLEHEAELREAQGTRSLFDLPHSALYLGALIVLSAMAWFNTNGWEKFDKLGVTVLSGALMFLFMVVGGLSWHGLKDKTPGGLFFTLAVCFVPLVVFGILRYEGKFDVNIGLFGGKTFFKELNQNFVYMETATLLCGLVTLLFIRFPLLTVPIALAFWFFCMDVGALVYEKALFIWTDNWKEISMIAGGLMLGVAYILDRNTREDFSKWLYFFGLAATWSAFSFLGSATSGGVEFGRWEYCLVSVLLMVVGIFLHRRAFAIFGGLGVLMFLNELAFTDYKDSPGCAFTLVAIGTIMMLLGMCYYHNRKEIRAWFAEKTPGFIMWLQPERARA